MCTYCKGIELKNAITTYVAVLGNYTIIIRNVPCLECVQCGEKYYTDEVMERIEQIVNIAKQASGEFFVTEYKAA